MSNSIKVLAKMDSFEHEQVVFCQDKDTGLKAIIAIHDTTLGPALGGTRMWDYDNEEEALEDVLRLSRGMTFKAAISGLELGGGKAVIIGDASKHKTENLMRKFGKFVDTLSGNYITAEDVGMSTKDMEYVRMETEHVTGIPKSMGGSGDPSPVTAYGVYMGIKASSKFLWGDDNLEDKKILVQGIGHVGEYLVKYLSDEKAKVFVSDINQKKLDNVASKYGATIIDNDSVFDFDMDIYAPCALGGILNTSNINKLKCSIVCGGANNQFEDETRDSLHLREKGIVYAPDFFTKHGLTSKSRMDTFDRFREDIEKDLSEVVDLIKKDPEVNIKNIFATGFSNGGFWVCYLTGNAKAVSYTHLTLPTNREV